VKAAGKSGCVSTGIYEYNTHYHATEQSQSSPNSDTHLHSMRPDCTFAVVRGMYIDTLRTIHFSLPPAWDWCERGAIDTYAIHRAKPVLWG